MNVRGTEKGTGPICRNGPRPTCGRCPASHKSDPSPFPVDPASSSAVGRLVIDPPAPGAWNMAVDEVLWQWSAASGRCAWRFYRWDEPTLSLGYFQSYEDREEHAASRACPVVRRPSGGGAIVHDKELTYSFVVPAGHRLAGRPSLLYRTIHTVLIEVLAGFGVEAALCGGPEDAGPARQPFLCFQRRSPGDVLVGAAKVAGSAQRRSRGAVLQHGSLLLARSSAAPEIEGLESAAPGVVDEQQLLASWLEKLSQRLGVTWQKEPLTDQQRCEAEKLVQTRYGSLPWTRARGRQCQVDGPSPA